MKSHPQIISSQFTFSLTRGHTATLPHWNAHTGCRKDTYRILTPQDIAILDGLLSEAQAPLFPNPRPIAKVAAIARDPPIRTRMAPLNTRAPPA